MKKYNELTTEDVTIKDSVSTLSDIVDNYNMFYMSWKYFSAGSIKEARLKVVDLLRKYCSVMNSYSIIRIRCIEASFGSTSYSIEDLDLNGTDIQKNIKEIDSIVKNTIYEIKSKELLNIVDRLLNSKKRMTLPIYISNKKIYVDEQAYFFDLWYNETTKNNVIDNREYKWLSGIQNSELSDETIGILNVMLRNSLTIRKCKIKKLNIDAKRFDPKRFEKEKVMSIYDCIIRDININVKEKYINIDYRRSEVDKINLFIRYENVSKHKEDILPVVMLSPNNYSTKLSEINIYVSEKIIEEMKHKEGYEVSIEELFKIRTTMIVSETAILDDISWIAKVNLVVMKEEKQ